MRRARWVKPTDPGRCWCGEWWVGIHPTLAFAAVSGGLAPILRLLRAIDFTHPFWMNGGSNLKRACETMTLSENSKMNMLDARSKQTLRIKNFLSIRSCFIEIAGITVLIGPQASGKSIIARLIFFFREYIDEIFRQGSMKKQNKLTFDKSQREKFYEIFPYYAWDRDEFEVEYQIGEYVINIFSAKKSSSIKIKTSNNLTRDFVWLKKSYKNFVENEIKAARQDKRRPRTSFYLFRRHILKDVELDPLRYDTLFVPAARSFYAQMREELVPVLALDKRVDPILLQFADFYEYAKSSLGTSLRHPRRGSKRSEMFFEKILKGIPFREDETDWIRMGDRKIEVRKASSGQQEALPLLLSLNEYPLISNNSLLIIEEPEAHLFPTAQKDVMDFMIHQFSGSSSGILFTTHSPYLLSCLNNGVLRAKIEKEPFIKFEEVRVYLIANGKSRDLRDKKLKLIDANPIDSVSDEIYEEFDNIMSKIDDQ